MDNCGDKELKAFILKEDFRTNHKRALKNRSYLFPPKKGSCDLHVGGKVTRILF
jgi:hypothetical protein